MINFVLAVNLKIIYLLCAIWVRDYCFCSNTHIGCIYIIITIQVPISVATRSETHVRDRSIVGIWGWMSGCLSVVTVVCYQLEVYASGWSLVQRSPTECCVSECDRESSLMRWPCPTGGCWTVGRNNTTRYGYKLVLIISVKKCSTLNKFYANMRFIRQLKFSPRRFTWHRLW